jgi:hypothetical protein
VESGVLSEVLSGPETFRSNRKPSLLEYCYRNKRMAVLWGAVIFIWGFLWSLKKVIFA